MTGDFQEFVHGILPYAASEAAQDPNGEAVLNAMTLEALLEARDDAIGRAVAFQDGAQQRYHDHARTGIIRTTGVSEDEYDTLLFSGDRSKLTELRSQYLRSF